MKYNAGTLEIVLSRPELMAVCEAFCHTPKGATGLTEKHEHELRAFFQQCVKLSEKAIEPMTPEEQDSVDRWWGALQKASKNADRGVSEFDHERLKEARDDARKPGDGPAY